jgi:hypothetical protein
VYTTERGLKEHIISAKEHEKISKNKDVKLTALPAKILFNLIRTTT